MPLPLQLARHDSTLGAVPHARPERPAKQKHVPLLGLQRPASAPPHTSPSDNGHVSCSRSQAAPAKPLSQKHAGSMPVLPSARVRSTFKQVPRSAPLHSSPLPPDTTTQSPVSLSRWLFGHVGRSRHSVPVKPGLQRHCFVAESHQPLPQSSGHVVSSTVSLYWHASFASRVGGQAQRGF